MAGANSNIQISDLDFDEIKNNLKTFLRSQDKFKDYDFEGSALSILLDTLAYNTHYNAYHLNMVANEMFLDTAAIRSSVISHAKLLNYTPKSATAPSATINLIVTSPEPSVTIPKFTRFKSEAIDNVNYTFVTKDDVTENTTANTATFNNLEIIQGEPINLTYTYSSLSNPKSLFVLPDSNIDTATLVVQVQVSSTNASLQTFTLGDNVLNIKDTSTVYFLQEGLNGNYEIYFGDGILGKKLTDGNVVRVSYVVTSGTAAINANNFVLLDGVGTSSVLFPVSGATNGGEKEGLDSIKYHAPKAYSAQGRAVTVEDYISIIQNNNIGLSFDSVSVWSGDDNIPPAFGQVFISVKPKGSYNITSPQKDRLINDVIKPVSVLTVQPTVLDPDYTFLKLTANVLYDQKKTTLTSTQLQNLVKTSIQNFADTSLNTFNSTFSVSDLITSIQNVSDAIITNECKVQVQKKFYPTLGTPKSYTLVYDVPLERGLFTASINSSPTIQYFDNSSIANLINDVYIEEVPFPSSGVDTINILNGGFNYIYTPIVKITGDGTGATATPVVVNGSISRINVTNSGNNYTQAIVTIENAPGDTSGSSASAFAVLQGRYGKLRSYYYGVNNIKTILNDHIATVDYNTGTITFNDFAPYDIDDPLGQLTITANPQSTIISSSKNRIISVDAFDSNSITVNITAK